MPDEFSTARRVQRIALPAVAPGTSRELQVHRFGPEGARPFAYLQTGLHADELPGILVLRRLGAMLEDAAVAGALRGEVALVPFANPAGLAQHVSGRSLGRFALSGAGNFNRHYPDLAARLGDSLSGRLGPDRAANVATVRAALREALGEPPVEETAFLRHTLLGLALEADIALDLHCDSEASLHVYLGPALWPDAADLCAELGSRATLLAEDSGGQPFDESVGGPWWSLAARHPDTPVPPACLAATVELRGERDVDEGLAEIDAGALFRFLQRRGVIAGDPGPAPASACSATPLTGVDLVESPRAGLLVFHREPGEAVEAGEVVAEVIDPLRSDARGGRLALRSRTDGVLFARVSDRLARPGTVVAKVAGAEPLEGREPGALMAD